MTAFKAEAHRRGKRMIAEKKRKRRRLLVVSSTVTVCCLLFVAIAPWIGLYTNKMESKDSISPDAPIMDGNHFGSLQEAPTMIPPDMNVSDSNQPSYTTSVYSVEVTAREDGGDSLLHTNSNHLAEIGLLLRSINESDRDELPDGNVGESETGYHITVTYRFDDQDEYIWSGASWTIVEEERTVALTSDEIKALTTLLLQSEAN